MLTTVRFTLQQHTCEVLHIILRAVLLGSTSLSPLRGIAPTFTNLRPKKISMLEDISQPLLPTPTGHLYAFYTPDVGGSE